MNGWKSDKKWSDVYIPTIKKTLGLYLIGEPPIEEDQERNTDLMVLKMDAVRIGCRLRRADKGYHLQYGDEFTIRTSRPSGCKTEMAKIIEGWGNYFFYGFGHPDGSINPWHLCDLNVFRLWYFQSLYKGEKPGVLQQNRDGSSNFIAFKVWQLPKDFVVANGKNKIAA